MRIYKTLIPVSLGELVDKLTILEIKIEMISDKKASSGKKRISTT